MAPYLVSTRLRRPWIARCRVAALGIHDVSFEEGDLGTFATDKKFDAIVGRFVLLYVRSDQGIAKPDTTF